MGIQQEMVRAMRADLGILLQLQIVDHGTTVRAFVPQAFRHVFTAVVAAQAGFAENAHGDEVFGRMLAVQRQPHAALNLAPCVPRDNHVLMF